MDRREFLVGATAGVAAAAFAGAARADTHAAPAGHAKHGPIDPKSWVVRETTLACQEAAGDCVRHCVAELAAGNRALADCLQSVLRMEAVTAAVHAVVASDPKRSARTRELVAVCADYCRDCAAECEPHAEMHPECKACLEACRRCIEACEAYTV